ncbi:MAG: hypothetical protein J07HQX50_02152, partial [Haloquadratum sp. J07HQX50]
DCVHVFLLSRHRWLSLHRFVVEISILGGIAVATADGVIVIGYLSA